MRRRSGELTSREKRFCEVYSLGGDAAAAAVDAGYDMPEKAGVSLLSRDDINNEVSRLYEKRLRNARQKAYAGYERIAFGSVNDAVRLVIAHLATHTRITAHTLLEAVVQRHLALAVILHRISTGL